MTADYKNLDYNTLMANDGGAAIELSREHQFVDGHSDIFDLLQYRNGTADKDSGYSYDDAIKKEALSFFQSIRSQLLHAKDRILEQDRSITRLKSFATIDPDSGIYNKLGLERNITREIARMARENITQDDKNHQKVSRGGILILIEIDNLFKMGCTHGEKAKTACFKLMGEILKGEIRDMDFAAHHKAGEFVLVLPYANAQRIVGRAQKLAQRLNKLSFVIQDTEIPVNVSLGLKTYGPQDTFNTLFG